MKNKEIKTRQQLIEKLNKIDTRCVDEGLHFYDLKTLYESKEYKLSAQDKADIKKVAAIEDDPDTLKAYIDSKAIEEDIDWDAEDYEGGYSEWEMVERKSVQDYDGFWTDYALWHNDITDRWVCIFGDTDIYYPENAEYDAEFENEEEAREWFENYSTEEYDDFDESLKEDLASQFKKIHDKDEYLWNLHNTDYSFIYDKLAEYGDIDEEGIDGLFRKMPEKEQRELFDKLVAPYDKKATKRKSPLGEDITTEAGLNIIPFEYYIYFDGEALSEDSFEYERDTAFEDANNNLFIFLNSDFVKDRVKEELDLTIENIESVDYLISSEDIQGLLDVYISENNKASIDNLFEVLNKLVYKWDYNTTITIQSPKRDVDDWDEWEVDLHAVAELDYSE